MKTRSVFIFVIMFFAFGMLAYAEDLTADDLIEKIKSVVVIDFGQEDQLKPTLGDCVDSINHINDQIQKGVDQKIIVPQLSGLYTALDSKLKAVLTDDQMRQWEAEKKVVYKEIMATPGRSSP